MPFMPALLPTLEYAATGYAVNKNQDALDALVNPKMPEAEAPSEAPQYKDAQTQAMEDLQRKRAKLSRTILTSPQGDLSSAGSVKKTLLGS